MKTHAVPGSLGQLCVPTTRLLHDLEDKSFREDPELNTSTKSRLGIVLICNTRTHLYIRYTYIYIYIHDTDLPIRFYDIRIDSQVLSKQKTL